MWKQISLGSLVLGVSSACHIAVLVTAIDILPTFAAEKDELHWPVIIAAFAAILFGHTVQVWLWALSLKALGAIAAIEDAVYFALVTSTTLGYGDITLRREWRLFGAMAAVNGLLTFGLSTAFLIEVFARSFG